MTAPGAPSPLVAFYRGTAADSEGRRLAQILSWDDEALEHVHDYIQWLFPLVEPSAFNPDAPLVTPADRERFRTEADLGANLRRSLVRMLAFYGFRLIEEGGPPRVERGETWAARSRTWLRPGNHNLLRLTRIIKSLMLLGQPELGRALADALLAEFGRTADRIGETTARYWRQAAAGDGS